ncbi:ABC transporter permease [Fulvivirga ligni]|uniref:ABC transporter permease n=1 Tax=Fulvivirga ligni TaxID=2904246 RepID=UPI001F468A5B|nr:ABC transporter permease [Fulvivirga ligni]UII21000.1 ABC transporter permease [Fulvivirga ligni]
MRILRFLLQKEFRQIFRDPAILRMILVAPLMQLLILPQAADYEVKHIQLAVVDHDHSDYSHQITDKILSSGYFELAEETATYVQALDLVETDDADIVLEIPPHFEKNLIRDNKEQLFLAANAINGTKALVGSGYLNNIIRDFNNEIRLDWSQPGRFSQATTIGVETINWYNPLMNYKFFMVPGILVFLVTMVGTIMCSLNIVKEKEIGTIEQINVTPVRKHHFILGKLIPFLVIGFVVFSLGLLIAWLVYGIVPLGNIAVLYLFLFVYLVAVLGLGLLISTYSSTQQQAMSLSFFFIMIFNLLSGLFTPIESMPEWAQVIAHANPLTYFIEVMRLVVLKGSGLADIGFQLLVVAGFAIVFNAWAILNYRKAS